MFVFVPPHRRRDRRHVLTTGGCSGAFAIAAALCALLGAACGDDGSHAGESNDAGASLSPASDVFDTPIAGITDEQLAAFDLGDELFDLPLREPDGLGPLYTRNNCGGCHGDGLRGPGLVQKMSVVGADGITPLDDQSMLAFGHTVHPLLAAGATMPILPPAGASNVHVSIRVGPPILGRGYMEAVLDSEIERVEREQARRTDGIHGRINHVAYASEPNSDESFHRHQKGDVVIGRFGLKARIATLDDFTADALAGDMGITSPLRPTEFPNPDGLLDDDKPGVDVTEKSVNMRAMYTRQLEIPRRVGLTTEGEKLFEQVKCAVCHVPALHTSKSYPIAPLADIDAPVFTDFLLHDVGDALADGLAPGAGDGMAGPRDFRTAPLIGLRFYRTFLHDGRAHSVEEAIMLHASKGSEANVSVDLFEALDAEQRAELLTYVTAL